MQSKKETLIISMFPSINYKSARRGANCGIMKTPNKTRRKARYPIAVFKVYSNKLILSFLTTLFCSILLSKSCYRFPIIGEPHKSQKLLFCKIRRFTQISIYYFNKFFLKFQEPLSW